MTRKSSDIGLSSWQILEWQMTDTSLTYASYRLSTFCLLWPPFCRRHFETYFLYWKYLYLGSNLAEFFSQESNQQHLSTGLNNESQKHTKDTPLRPMNTLSTIIVVVCFITNSFLTSLFFHLHLLYQSYLGLCQATCVQSLQRQPRSAVAITTCEVRVSAADSQTIPTVASGVSNPLCCRLTLTFYADQWEPIVIYHSITLLVVIQLCSPRCWHLDSNCTVVQGVYKHTWGLYCRWSYYFCIC